MYDDLLNAINAALSKKFVSYGVHTETVEQGDSKPCFFIGVVSHEFTKQNMTYYKVVFNMCVRFYPSDELPNKEIGMIGEKLYECLKLISFDDGSILEGKNVSSRNEDGKLNFFITYSATLMEDTVKVYMETLDVKEGVKR